MKRAWKGLFRKGEANVVKIVCLSVGLAIGLVMLAEVIFERSYDNFLPGLKETYRVEERYKQKDTTGESTRRLLVPSDRGCSAIVRRWKWPPVLRELGR